jgi:signal transduction histidine kinase
MGGRFESLVADLCAGFIGIRAEDVDRQIEHGLRRIVEELDLDLAGLGEFGDDARIHVTHMWTRAGIRSSPRLFDCVTFPWVAARLVRGETVCLASMALVPFVVGDVVAGALGVTTFRRRRHWPEAVVQRLRLLGEVFAVALMRSRAERALAESTALRDAIFTSLHGEVVAIARDGTIVATNGAWTLFAEENGGDPARAGVGVNYVDVCRRAAAEGDHGAKEALEAITAVGEGSAHRALLEYPCHGRHRTQWFLMTVVPFQRPEGGVVISHIDVTRRHQAEEDFKREREALTHALRVSTLGELAGSLVHEVNQPLTAILSNAEAAARLLATELAPDDEKLVALTDIAHEARRASQVVKRLRALFKKEHTDRQLVDVAEVLAEVTALLQKDFERRRIRAELHLPAGLPRVHADVVQLQQVMLNLFVNAAEAVGERDEDARAVHVEASLRAPGLLEVAVRDAGIGVDEASLERIFERFVTTKPEGLGMGLSISRSIVQSHGGRIWATRNADRGLTVHVELPCQPA